MRLSSLVAVYVDWLPSYKSASAVYDSLLAFKRDNPRMSVGKASPDSLKPKLPRRLWLKLLEGAVDEGRPWGEVKDRDVQALSAVLKRTPLTMTGKSTNKEEFVTAGGINLKEVDLKTMQSKVSPGLFSVGECNDIDAVTGGYNFLNCWTTGYAAGLGVARYLGEGT